MMIKTVLLGVFVLILFSCGELLESKPSDWYSRQDFSDKPYGGKLFKKWDEVMLIDGIQAREEGYALSLNRSQHWKGSGEVSWADSPVYYVFWAEHAVTVTFDWKYQRDGIGLAGKKVGKTILDDYGLYRERISAGPNEYLVIRISSSGKMSIPTDTKPDWELGFTVD
jgi:hypothetical protein